MRPGIALNGLFHNPCSTREMQSSYRVVVFYTACVAALSRLGTCIFYVTASSFFDFCVSRSPFVPHVCSADGFRSTRAAYVKVWLELERKNMDQAQSELEVELLWGQLDRREKELNMSKIGAR